MALTFFWRCEGTTLDGTHDYSAGDTTATLNGAASISATAAKIGSNGVINTDGADFYYFDSASIVTIDQGSLGYWVKQVGSLIAAGSPLGMGAEQNQYTTTDNLIFPRTASGGEVSAALRESGGSLLLKTTTDANMVADTWYFVTMSWHLSADKLRVRVYDSSGSLLDEANNDTDLTDLSAATPTSLDRLFVGQRSSSTVVCHVDNVFVGSSYDDADTFLTKRDITSFTDFANKYLKLKAHSSAQSDTGIAGVVFQAPSGGDITGAKIGEFTDAAFEATLEGGEAVLKVPVSEFGGSALTTSDTPVALVRNTTDTTGIVSCTVIEE